MGTAGVKSFFVVNDKMTNAERTLAEAESGGNSLGDGLDEASVPAEASKRPASPAQASVAIPRNLVAETSSILKLKGPHRFWVIFGAASGSSLPLAAKFSIHSSGLPYSTTDQQVRDFFLGQNIKDVKFVFEPDGRPSGLVRFILLAWLTYMRGGKTMLLLPAGVR